MAANRFYRKTGSQTNRRRNATGGICSPVIANLALDGLEAKLREKYPKASNASRKAKANLVRFADDFIITGSSKELLEKEIKPLVEQFMKERGLNCPRKRPISLILRLVSTS